MVQWRQPLRPVVTRLFLLCVVVLTKKREKKSVIVSHVIVTSSLLLSEMCWSPEVSALAAVGAWAVCAYLYYRNDNFDRWSAGVTELKYLTMMTVIIKFY